MPSLVLIEGPGEGTHFPLNIPLVSFGRDDTCTYQILDSLVSRKHLQIRLDERLAKRVAGDYRSANRVFVNGKQVVLDVALSDGDRIKIGNTTLMYLAADHADGLAAVAAAAKKKGEWQRTTVMGGE